MFLFLKLLWTADFDGDKFSGIVGTSCNVGLMVGADRNSVN
jgi:hypothetical protein